MIQRYCTKEMSAVFSSEMRFEFMKKVEVQCALVQAEMNIIPKKDALQISKKAKFSVKRINQIEETTKHDVIAFVSNLAENIGPSGRFVHYGLTSSDVLDTALSLQLSEAFNILSKDLTSLRKTLIKLIKTHEHTICAGRTHGIFAEITTFGFKMAGFLSELNRNIKRVESAVAQIKICKLSGAVGSSSALPPEFESKVAKRLKLNVEPFATQVIPRDRHAELVSALTFLLAGYERISVELRHLQRSEVGEVIEGFSLGQKGSSAMPHKKNPISAENISGISRLFRGYLVSSFENIALWHERDISHSSVERVVFPDMFHLAHYATRRLNNLLENIYIDIKKMKQNTNLLGGVMYSSHLLLHLVNQHNISREKAYKLIQNAAHSLEEGESLKLFIQKDKILSKYFSTKDLDKIFSGSDHLKAISARIKRYGDLL
jgi:adenylosuccinate lyase